jgi:hypothetical protein
MRGRECAGLLLFVLLLERAAEKVAREWRPE